MVRNWIKVAQSYLGTCETPGALSTAKISEWLALIGLPENDEIAWCSAFLNGVMIECGIDGTGSGVARSWLKWGLECGPVPGAVGVLHRGNPKGWEGHVVIVIEDNGSEITVIGGNQSDEVSVKRYPKSRVLGYRWPAGRLELPKE